MGKVLRKLRQRLRRARFVFAQFRIYDDKPVQHLRYLVYG